MDSPSNQAEIRLMGLILTQAASIGLAVAIFDSGIWLTLEDATLNGVTYAMAAFAVQGVAYYLFKMFFQQSMDERARMASQERERKMRYRSMEMTFDRRRQDMEMRMQEAQLEAELQWMEKNPGKTPPWIAQRMTAMGTGTSDFIPLADQFVGPVSSNPAPVNLGFDYGADAEGESSPKRGADGKFVKKEA